MVPDSVAAFRSEYRRQNIGPHYSGIAHLGFTSLVTLTGIVLAAAQVRSPSGLELLTLPVAFLFANYVEYRAHRGPMHHRSRSNFILLRLLFERHTLQHHRYYTEEAMCAESTRDYKMVLFPPAVVIFFMVGQLVPMFILLRFTLGANVAWIFCATGLAYFLSYEWLHLCYHQPDDSFFGRLALIRRLRRHHQTHHDPRLMADWNFNITFPIADAVFGTTFKDPK